MDPLPSRLTIVLATYQGETYLPRLLQSILAQSHSEWTLLVRDDGSRDATPQILADAARHDRRIAIIPDAGQRLGALGNFSRLLERAWHEGADYVLPADQDDIWHADKVARQLTALQAAEDDRGPALPQMAYCDAVMVDATGRTLHGSFLRHNRLPHGSGRPLKTLLGRCPVLGCACAVNRALLELALPLPDEAASHDWWLALCAAAAGWITCLDVPLVDYRRHKTNASQAAFWNVLRGPRQWRQRWHIGWQTFVRSLQQAKALCNRLRQRQMLAGPDGELLEAFCRVVDQPNRWRRVWELHRLGVPAIHWPRRALFDACMWRLSVPPWNGL